MIRWTKVEHNKITYLLANGNWLERFWLRWRGGFRRHHTPIGDCMVKVQPINRFDPTRMVFLMGSETHAQQVAVGAGLSHDKWQHLHWFRQLMGHKQPQVVVLDSASRMKCWYEMLEMLVEREAIFLSEEDLK